VREITPRRARAGDVPHIQRLVNFYADRGDMLGRSLNEIYENLRDFFVVEADGDIVGCAACHVTWADLAEVKSLAVADGWQGKGLGTTLLEACLSDADALGLPIVFTLTYRPEFFERHGFHRVDKNELPQKIWAECIRCVKFPDCGEIALLRRLEIQP